MAMDFPASPTEGQTYQAPGGPLYTYRAPAWRSGVTQPQVAKAQRNRVVNGAMQISQENGNAAQAAAPNYAYFSADQWSSSVTLSTGTASAQRLQGLTPNGSNNRIRMTVGTAQVSLAANNSLQFIQPIEGIRVADFRWGTASAKRVIFRFGFRGPAGTYTASVVNAATNRCYATGFTITAGQANTETEQVVLIPGDTSGVWAVDNSLGVYVRVAFAVGSGYLGVADAWQAGNLFGIPGMSNGAAT